MNFFDRATVRFNHEPEEEDAGIEEEEVNDRTCDFCNDKGIAPDADDGEQVNPEGTECPACGAPWGVFTLETFGHAPLAMGRCACGKRFHTFGRADKSKRDRHLQRHVWALSPFNRERLQEACQHDDAEKIGNTYYCWCTWTYADGPEEPLLGTSLGGFHS